jgi:hypothetical protein
MLSTLVSQEALSNAEFFAVDLEMSGIELEGAAKNSLGDIPAARFVTICGCVCV